MTNGNDSAFPVPHINSDGSVQYDVYFGLTKREYFAAMALQGLCVNSNNSIYEISIAAYLISDALIEQLNKNSGV